MHVTDALNHRVAAASPAAAAAACPRRSPSPPRLPRLYPSNLVLGSELLPPCSTRHVARQCSPQASPMPVLICPYRPR